MAALTLHEGDCLEVLATLPEAHFDAIVTDPPYHLTSIVKRFGADGAAEAKEGTDGLFKRSSRGFMGKTWDGGDIAFRAETWTAALRVLKPGGHLVAFNHSRTYHHMTTAIELAGFELRDCIFNLYGANPAWTLFLDSLEPEQIASLARALAGSDAPLLAWLYGSGFPKSHDVAQAIEKLLSVPGEADPAALEQWQGWGTALKPGIEPIVLARKPIAAGSIARQHLATGTGGLNIDAARIPSEKGKATQSGSRAAQNGWGAAPAKELHEDRWPANVCHDGSPEVLAKFPQEPLPGVKIGTQSTARFFYSGKASKVDRAGSDHPTVKPQELMRWLIRLTTARGGRVLDIFAGSGSTGWAAAVEGRDCHLIERDPGYASHIRARLPEFSPEFLTAAPRPAEDDSPQPDLFGG